MSEFTSLIRLKLVNMANEQEVGEAVQSILEPGLELYAKNYGEILGKSATVLSIDISVDIPEFENVDAAIMAKLVSRRMTAEDRQAGVYANRGIGQGSFFVLEGIIRPVLEQFKVSQYFEFFRKSSTGEILIQDSAGFVLQDFILLPDKVFELSTLFGQLSKHLADYKEILQPIALESMVPGSQHDIDRTIEDVGMISTERVSSADLIPMDTPESPQAPQTIRFDTCPQEVDFSQYPVEA